MDAKNEVRQEAIIDRMLCGSMVYCTVFIISIWISVRFEIPLIFPIAGFSSLAILAIITFSIMWWCQRHRATIDVPRLQRQSSLDSGYTSLYGSIEIPQPRYKITNDDRFCQLSRLRSHEKLVQKELDVLNQRAREAYKKHFKASQALCRHDPQKAASCNTAEHRFDASGAWYAADAERTLKDKDLCKLQGHIRELRNEMQANFEDIV